ncbi:putative destroys radicals which are normally produced within the cells and which are toxic to biological systems [Lyophyllum shimeji]|uniref:Superoxide dismutase n=1 Tax=Lyophyllum shimeji TaxID=47721 RepID=A0A9P3PQK5_LYOSH|nr:putative destroys radicals which are normally produced within the cells and which are toxic to biological systems [Lyophyllum shimeji]
MLSLTRTIAHPTLARTYAGRAVASLHTLPDLPYAYNALEPYISEEIMRLHHQKHHQTYVNGLNAAEEAMSKAETPKKKISIQPALKFNGGGHINHSLFWKNLSPPDKDGGKLESGTLKSAIENDFGSVEAFKKTMNAKTAAVQGSGWGWLGYNTATKKLEIVTTPNQDPLLVYKPLIGIDIWEHAYYLQYKNVKGDYLSAIWNVINFKEAERRLEEVAKSL